MGAQKGYFNERTGESLALPIELWAPNRFHYSNIMGFSKTWRPTRGGCIFWMPLLVIRRPGYRKPEAAPHSPRHLSYATEKSERDVSRDFVSAPTSVHDSRTFAGPHRSEEHTSDLQS